MAVLNRDEVRLLAFVIQETRQTRRLGDRSRGRIRVQFARELLLEALDIGTVEAPSAPEQVHATWRRV
jgi:hypothetical protein